MEKDWNGKENWDCLKRFFPNGWEQAAQDLGAWRRKPRSIPTTESLMRLFLIHLADGCSLRETVVRAREGHLADISDVALLKRLNAAGEWLRWLAVKLIERRGVASQPPAWLSSYKVRTVDASVVNEPGSTGTNWKVHYCLQLFGLQCDEFYLTGPRIGESFRRFQISPGDLMMGDRAYGNVKGFKYVQEQGGHFLTRLKNKAFTLVDESNKTKTFLELMSPLAIGEIGNWNMRVLTKNSDELTLRICALRMSEESAENAIRRAKKEMSKKQKKLNDETLALHRYIVVATSLPESISARQILELYRARWQIELAFKRLKSIMGLGHLPKVEEASSRAWIHGKLFVAFLAQAITEEGRLFSRWGYPL
jgi:hypothetical protein